MKILVVSNMYPPIVHGGYEVECAGVVDFLRRRGDEVVVLTSRLRSSSVPSEEGVIRELPFLPETTRSHVLAPLHAWAGVRTVRTHLDRRRPDLVFVWNGAGIPHAAIHAILSSGVPTAFRVCQQWFGGLFSRDLFMRYLFTGHDGTRRAWAVLARTANVAPSLHLTPSVQANVAISWVSEYLRDAVPVPAELEPVLERTIPATTPSGALFASVERRPTANPVVAFIGRLSWEKGADIAIAALGLLTAQGYDAQLVIAGEGSPAERRSLEQAAVAAGVRERCSLVGRLQPEALVELLSQASALVVPSIWQEPLGLVVIEGALARVPLVASRVGGIPELVTEDHAILVPPGEPAQLAAGVARVLSQPVETSARVARAFSRAQSMSWAAYVEAMGAFVDDAHAVLTETNVSPRKVSIYRS